eukprot:m.250904 g.250904  ORF g.250904 m.250904 type:complete len:86 (-) comp17181_c5_seq3:281-538(-)
MTPILFSLLILIVLLMAMMACERVLLALLLRPSAMITVVLAGNELWMIGDEKEEVVEMDRHRHYQPCQPLQPLLFCYPLLNEMHV